MTERETKGFTVCYDRGEAQFPVYVMAVVAAVLIAGSFAGAGIIAFTLGIVAAAVAYFNYPLLETGRPRLGAGQHGLFIEGFGIIDWRAIDRIDLVTIAVRVMTTHELQIALKVPLGRALIVDWRRMPWYRLFMRLPWSMTSANVIRINIEPFDKPPEEVHRTFQRMWRYYRS